jgi:uncharacterized protein YndB with AHSA1/START domain
MNERSTHHASFVIERNYDASPSKVFNAFADPRAKARWFIGPNEWIKDEYQLDFRVGGREHLSGGEPGGQLHIFDAIYQDIVPNERIIFSYDMHIADQRISVSLTTVEFKPAGKGTRLTFTEHGVFLDGYDDDASRERGTRGLLDQLETALRG